MTKKPPCACGGEHYGKGKCKRCYMRERNVLPLLTCRGDECIRRVRNPSGYCKDCRPAPTARPCNRCGSVLPVESFARFGATERKDKKGWCCDPCMEARLIERAANRIERGVRFQRHGITAARFEQMLKDQDERCKICSRSFDDRIDIDHDHACCPGTRSCGECIRGLLCPPCNKALGLLGDNVEILRTAVLYVLKGGEC